MKTLKVYSTAALRDGELRDFGLSYPQAVISRTRRTATLPDGLVVLFQEAHDMLLNQRIHGLEFHKVEIHGYVNEEVRAYAKSRERLKS